MRNKFVICGGFDTRCAVPKCNRFSARTAWLMPWVWVLLLALNQPVATLADGDATNRAVDPSLLTSFEPSTAITVEDAPNLRERVAAQLQRARAQYTTIEAWAARRKEIREGFLKGAGLWPPPEKTPLKPIMHIPPARAPCLR